MPSFREIIKRRNTFDLLGAVHEAEYASVNRPIDTRSKRPIEPAHQFEVSLEPDDFTAEKSVNIYVLSFDEAKLGADTSCSKIIRELYIMKSLARYLRLVSDDFCAQGLARLDGNKTEKKGSSGHTTSAIA